MAMPRARNVAAWPGTDRPCDAAVLVSSRSRCEMQPCIDEALADAARIDRRVGKTPVLIAAHSMPGGRLVYAPTASLTTDHADVRVFGDAARAGIALAKAAGAVNPLLIVDGVPDDAAYGRAVEVAYLAAAQELWEPLEAREDGDEAMIEPVEAIHIFAPDAQIDLAYIEAVEAGRRLARDLCGTEPERMAPRHFAAYCERAFSKTPVTIDVMRDPATITERYPLLAAVARASMAVERHRPCIVHLRYEGEGPIERTLFLVGKAVTYDTGGADLKIDGKMAGMSRDKGGGAAVAGFLKVIAALRPKGLRVVAAIGAVRNAIGADAYVADEIIRGRGGTRIRVGNADAEGRLVMADLLAELREEASDAINAELLTIATLTSHAMIALGPYTAVLENGPARRAAFGEALAAVGDVWGDGCEVSRSRREDWDVIKARNGAYDVLSSNNGPSSAIARGHQFPLAFLIEASGLSAHGLHAKRPLPYVHLDIAGSAVEGGDWKHGKPTAAPVAMLAARYLT